MLLSALRCSRSRTCSSAPRGASAAAWVIASALALATHYYAVLAVVPEALWLLAVHRRRRAVQVAFGLVALCGLALIPLAISQHGTGKANWISHAPLGRRTAEIFPQFAAGIHVGGVLGARAAGARARDLRAGAARAAVRPG